MNKTSLYIWIDNLLSDGYTPEIRDLLQSFELSRKTNVPKKYKNIYLWNLQDYVGKILVEEVKAYSFSYHMSAIIKGESPEYNTQRDKAILQTIYAPKYKA